MKVDCLCTAELSDCGAFRYELRRVWDDTKRLIVFVMLNPPAHPLYLREDLPLVEYTP